MATIQGVYVALFGRPADPAGLAYFNEVTNGGQDLSAIGDLASTKEYQDRFKDQSNLQIVRSIYQSLFNRDPDAAGLNFFVDALNKGTLTINNIAIAILDGAQGNDKTVVENKIKSADAFTKAIDTPEETAAYSGAAAAAAGRAYLAGVTTTAKTDAQAAAAVKEIVSIGTGGVSLTIKDNDAVSVSPTASEAKNQTTGGDDTITVTDNYSAQSSFDGSFGNDTLVLKYINLTGAAATSVAPTVDQIKNIENLVVTSNDGDGTDGEASGGAVLNLNAVKGISSITSDASVDDLAVTNITLGTSLGVKGTHVGSVNFGFKAADIGGGSDEATLKLSKAVTGAETVTIAGIETLNVAVDGNSQVVLNAANLKTLNITGSGDLDLGTVANATKIDASALSGALTVTSDVDGAKITGTAGIDSITLGGTAANAQTVIITTAESSNFYVRETIGGFTSGTDKIDLSAFAFATTKVATFAADPAQGVSYGADTSVGISGNLLFIDSNKNGVVDLESDVVIQIAGIAAGDIVWVAA